MTNIVKYESMSEVTTKDGEKYYIPTSFVESIVQKSSGFVSLGGGFINIFEVKSIMPVEMTNIEQAIWWYEKVKRDKIFLRRAELKEKIGRDFKDVAEIHRYAKWL